MNKKNIIQAIALAATTTLITVVPVLAAPPRSPLATSTAPRRASTETNQEQRMTALQAKDAQAIDQRVAKLTDLISRIQGMKNISDAQKASIVSTVQNLINTLQDLKAQIGADTASSTLKAHSLAITQNYRVYALVMPELNIIAAADRMETIAGMIDTVGSKLQIRLAQATNIPNIAALQAALADVSAKLADAKTQVQTAVNEVTPLTPDQGDKTKMAANTAALKDARTKIQTAQKDLVAARKDIQTIVQALAKSDKKSGAGSNNATSTATSTHE